MAETHAVSVHEDLQSGGWYDRIHLSISFQICSKGDKSEDRSGQSRILQGISCVNCSVGSCIILLEYFFGTLVMKGMTTGFTILVPYWRAFSLPSASTKFVLSSYLIDPHTVIPGVGEARASIIDASRDLSLGCLRTRWRRSDCHKQKQDSSLNTTVCHPMSQLTPALHHASVCCVWYGVSGKQHMETGDLSRASSNLFPTVRADTMPVISAGFQLLLSIRQSQSKNPTIFLWCSPSGRTHVLLFLPHCCPESISLLLVLQSLHYSQLSVQSVGMMLLCPSLMPVTFHEVQKIAISCP